MKIKKYQFQLIMFIGLPVWFIGWGYLIWDYFLHKISGDLAKDLLGFILTMFIWFYPILKFNHKTIEFK
jgi:hypothetical protein